MKIRQLNVGDTVTDELTGESTVVLEVFPGNNVGYRVKSDYLEGLRHAWEILESIEWEKDEKNFT